MKLKAPWEERGRFLYFRTLSVPEIGEYNLIVFAERPGPPWDPGPPRWRWEVIRPGGSTVGAGTPESGDLAVAARESELFAMGIHAGAGERSRASGRP